MKRAGKLVAILACPLFASAALADPAPDPEIEFLLEAIGQSGCMFIRNGKEHASEDAEDHLRLKYRNGRKYADNAERFIERLASRSSWTGDIYYVRCGGSEQVPSGDWLSDRLDELRATD